jgi:mannose-6-phosphate isomerase
MRFQRLDSPRPWAGERLNALFPDAAVGPGIGEWIELCGLPGASSVVANGEWRDLSLADLMRDHRSALLGELAVSALTDFPLCVKFLDTAEMLSVQVHPHDQVVDGELMARGKSECWLVLDAAPEAVIYQGLRPGVTRAQLIAALDEPGGPVSLMHARAVKRGDFIYNAAGMVHAIGPGLALLEVQQNCATTWRLWDPPRKGQARELHIEAGLRDARLELPVPEILSTDAEDVLLASDGPFGVRSLRVNSARVVHKTWPGFTVITCLDGTCEITGKDRDNLQPAVLKAGETVLWPAAFDEFELYAGAWLAVSWAAE